MNSNPEVSIVVPVYNASKFLAQGHESLVNQTYGNLQIVYVDDGSTDDSGRMLDQFAAADSRVKVIHQANAGTLMARQAGVAATTGDWVTFMDPDDWLENTAIEELVAAANENTEVICFGTTLHGDGGLSADKLFNIDRYLNPAEGSANIPENIWGKFIAGEICRREFAAQMKIYATFAEDIYAFGRLKKTLQYPIKIFPRRLYHYRLGAGITANEPISQVKFARMLNALDLAKDLPELEEKLVGDFLELVFDRGGENLAQSEKLRALQAKCRPEMLTTVLGKWRRQLVEQGEYITEVVRALVDLRSRAWVKIGHKMGVA